MQQELAAAAVRQTSRRICRRGRLARAIAAADGRVGAPDPVRLALLWLDSDLAPNRDIFTHAAQAAFRGLDMALAERFAKAAVAAGAGVAAAVVTGAAAGCATCAVGAAAAGAAIGFGAGAYFSTVFNSCSASCGTGTCPFSRP